MVTNNVINFTKLDERAIAPTRTNEFDAGADLYAKEDVLLPSLPKVIMNWAWDYCKYAVTGYKNYYPDPATSLVTIVSTGIALEIPDGEVGLVLDRSSMGKKSIKVFGGVMDSPYRGDYMVSLLNLSFKDYQINAGDKIAQVVIVPCRNYKFRETEKLTETERGSAAFGSSGR